MIPLSVPHLKGNEWKYVKDCLDSGWVSSVGEYVTKFEEFLKSYLGRTHAVACVNGTSALHLALLAAGVQPQDEVIVPALSFVAPANAVRYVGAFPVFIDADHRYWQLDVQKLKDFLSKECHIQNQRLVNRHTQRVVKAIIPVDILGHPCDMQAIVSVAREYGLIVIEDNAESLGSQYLGKPTGALADIVCLSFNGNKIITASGGGMILTDNSQWALRAKYLSTQAKDDELEYIHHEIGFNARLTNVQAAIGLAQMECLDSYVEQKRKIAHNYQEQLKGIAGITLPQEAPGASSTFWLYTILINEKEYGQDRKALLKHLQLKGIQTRPLWHPLDLLKPFKDCYAYHVEIAHKLYKEALSLPSSVGLSISDQNKVIDQIKTKREICT